MSAAAKRRTSSDEHYLRTELYERVGTDDALFQFLQEGSLDGVWEPLRAQQLVDALSCGHAAEATHQLVSAAYEAGGTDNMTAVVLRVPGDEAVATEQGS